MDRERRRPFIDPSSLPIIIAGIIITIGMICATAFVVVAQADKETVAFATVMLGIAATIAGNFLAHAKASEAANKAAEAAEAAATVKHDVQTLSITVDGRLTQLLEVEKAAATAKATLAAQEDERRRTMLAQEATVAAALLAQEGERQRALLASEAAIVAASLASTSAIAQAASQPPSPPSDTKPDE